MFWSTTKRVFRVLDRFADWFLFGFLLHRKRRKTVLAVMASVLAAMALITVLQEGPAPSDRVWKRSEPAEIARAEPTVSPADREAYLLGRTWLEKMPKGERDSFSIYLFDSENVGVYITVKSFYDFEIEIFKLDVRNNKIRLVFPHNRQKAQTEFVVEDHRGRGDINLRLTLKSDPRSGGKAKHYYSHVERTHQIPEWLHEAAQGAIREFARR